MHPNKFFSEVSCRVGVDIFEEFDNDLRDRLKNVHPLNFIKTRVTLPVYKVLIEYDTINGNHRSTEKFMIMDMPMGDECLEDIEADMLLRDYNDIHKENPMLNLQILDVVHICDAVLPIGC